MFDTWWMQCHDHESNVFWVFISILIWLWVCFAKWAMFWCEFRWVLSLLYPLLSPTSCSSYFYSFFFAFFFCFEFIWNTSVKRKQTNEPTKQNKKQLIRFISLALPCGLPHSSLFICVFFFFFFLINTEQGGQELELSESLKRRNFLSGSQWPQSQN